MRSVCRNCDGSDSIIERGRVKNHTHPATAPPRTLAKAAGALAHVGVR